MKAKGQTDMNQTEHNIDFSMKDFDPQQALETLQTGAYGIVLTELANLAAYTQAHEIADAAKKGIQICRAEMDTTQKAYSKASADIEQAKVHMRQVSAGDLAEAGLTRDQAKDMAAGLRRDLVKLRDQLAEQERILHNWEALLALIKDIKRPNTPYLKAVIKAAR